MLEKIICKHYTLFIDWHKSISQIYSLMSNINVEFVNQRDMIHPRIHSTFDCHERLGKTLSDPGDWNIFPKFEFPMSRLLLPNKYMVLSPYSGKPSENRRMSDRAINRIIRSSNHPVIVIGNRHQQIDAKYAHVINLVGKTSLLEAMSIVSGANIFVGFQGVMSFVAMSNCVNSTIYTRQVSDVRSIKVRTPRQWLRYCSIVED